MSTTACVNDLEIPKEEILGNLEALLSDRRFASAERNGKFLRYVVERTLEGKSDEIKETVIATEVYGRVVDYDPKSDSIVRVEASRLRQKLRNYYENEGKLATVRIHMPSGSYVPHFEPIIAAVPNSEIPSSENHDGVAKKPALAAAPVEVLDGVGTVPPQQSGVKPAHVVCAVITGVFGVLLSLQVARASKVVESHDPAALAAWQEGVTLLQQDPNVGQAEAGAPPTLLRAIERLEFSVARDSNLAGAWAKLAEAYEYAFPYVGRDATEDARRGETAARRAIALDPNLSAGHHMLGLILWMFKWDFEQAELSYRRALELDPANVYAVVEYADLLRETGRVNEAAEQIRKSRALLPALPQLAVKEAEIQLDLKRPDAAMVAANGALRLARDFLRANFALGMAQEMKGDTKAALANYEHVLAVNPLDRRTLPAYGYLLARSGQKEKAKEVAARLEQMNSTIRNCAFQVAMVYAGMGEDDLALDWLERAWRTHQVHFPFASVEYRFRELQKYPRFRQLLARVNLRPVL